MKTVLINLTSNSIGDTVCFIPCADFFRKKTNDKIIVRIKPYFEQFFSEFYPELIYYREGDSFDKEIKVNYDFTKPMQSAFAEQLGFHNWKYLRPKINLPKDTRPIEKKYITAGIHSTSQLKYWNSPLGGKFQEISPYWSQLFKKIRKHNLLPVVVEKDEMFGVPPHRNGLPSSCLKKTGLSLEDTMTHIYHSEFFIGLSSGLSWIAHALGKPVVMISNFSEDWHEIDLGIEDYIRITNKSVCHGCWNKVGKEHKFDFSEWYWCPKHKNTNRQFECHYNITPDDVYDKIKKLL